MNYEIIIYQTSSGKQPFSEWVSRLKEKKIQALVLKRIDRVKIGNFGDTEVVGSGVSELRIHNGPGYRIYYAKKGSKIIILLCGGTKRTQEKDISKAKEYWLDYQDK